MSPPCGRNDRLKAGGTPRRRGGRVILMALGAMVLAGCATKRDIRDLQVEMREIAQRQEQLLTQLDRLHRATQDSLRYQSEALFQIRGDFSRRFLDVQDQLVTLQELTGQSQRNLASLRDQIESQRRTVVQDPFIPGGEDREEGDFIQGAQAATGSGDATELYNAAVTAFNRGTLMTARRAFDQFLVNHPTHALAPDAQYYLADILTQEGELDQALAAFLRIQELHPTAPRVPDALYRAGILYLELGDEALGRELLERVVNSYPEVAVAANARSRLESLR